MKKGKVFLVGAGPGDPELLTLRGGRCLRRADVVIYDHLVNPALLSLAPGSAEVIYAGKSSGRHTLPQRRINQLLVRHARRGKSVVRLKGGDPVLFARGAEEGLELARCGIDFEIVPGVSSAVAVPAAAGIPLTCRSTASAVTVATGHEAPGRGAPGVAWGKLLDERSTVVVLMGVANLRTICRRLARPGMPAAVIGDGTLPSQRVVTGTLATIAGQAERAGIRPPAVLVAGNVVRLRSRLYPHMQLPFLPLSGKHILVTRPASSGVGLAALLRNLGATVTLFPLLRIVPAPEGRIDALVRRITDYQWVVLSSASGADLLAGSLRRTGIPRAALRGLRLAAIGPKTAERLVSHGLRPSLVPRVYRQEGLADEFGRLTGPRGRVLLLHAGESRGTLEERLRRTGFAMTAFDLYRTRMTGSRARLRALLASSPVDAVTVTSSMCARSLARLLDAGDRARLAVAAIGPVSAAAARALGLRVPVVAGEYTSEGLAASLCSYYGSRRKT